MEEKQKEAQGGGREKGDQMTLETAVGHSSPPSIQHEEEESVPPSTSKKPGGWRAIKYILGIIIIHSLHVYLVFFACKKE